MNPVINPDTINVLCDDVKSDSHHDSIPKLKAKSKKLTWDKIKSWVNDFCETMKPLIDTFAPIFNVFLGFKEKKSIRRLGKWVRRGVV